MVNEQIYYHDDDVEETYEFLQEVVKSVNKAIEAERAELGIPLPAYSREPQVPVVAQRIKLW